MLTAAHGLIEFFDILLGSARWTRAGTPREVYAENMLTLTVARSYVKKLLKNAKVVQFLSANHSEILSERNNCGRGKQYE